MDEHRYHYDTVVAAIRLLDEHDDLGDDSALRARLVELAGVLREGVDDDEPLRTGDHDVEHLLPGDR